MTGRFICLEGPEGAGKTTQAKLLAGTLQQQGVQVLLTREPGGSRLGESLRELLLSTDQCTDSMAELLLFAAARAQHIAERIKPALEQGVWVLCDRFTLSTLAYQGYGRGMSLDLVRQACSLGAHALMPDMSLVLDLPVDAGFRRVHQRGDVNRFDQLDSAFHQRVRRGFIELCREPSSGPCRCLDASGTPEQVHRRILAALEIC